MYTYDTEYRTKKREAGYEYLHTWVHKSKKSEFLAFVAKLNEEK